MKTRHFIGAAICALATTSTGALGATINVPADQPTIQAAINVATPGSEILLADGIHSGPGNRDVNFMGKLITVRSASGNAAACVIDCLGLGRGFLFNSAETPASQLRNVTIRNGDALGGAFGGGIHCLAASPTIAGCIIRDCEADSGGGLSIVSSTALVLDCTVTMCEASVSGGGVYVIGGGPTLDNLRITFNEVTGNSGAGAGLLLQAEDSTILNCDIEDNLVSGFTGRGGGVSCQSSTAFFSDTNIRRNEAQFGANALLQSGGDLEFLRCEITNNQGEGDAGTIHEAGAVAKYTSCKHIFNGDPDVTFDADEFDIDGDSTVSLVQCLVVSTHDSTNSIIVTSGSSMTAENSTLDVEFAGSGGNNIIITNSLLEDFNNQVTRINSLRGFSDFIDAAGMDYRPMPTSLAIDAGDNTLTPIDEYDLDGDMVVLERLSLDLGGQARFTDLPSVPDTGMSDGLNPIIDIGAYELPENFDCPWDLDGDGSVGSGDLAQLIGLWTQTNVPADFDGGGVGASDLATLLGRWGPCP